MCSGASYHRKYCTGFVCQRCQERGCHNYVFKRTARCGISRTRIAHGSKLIHSHQYPNCSADEPLSSERRNGSPEVPFAPFQPAQPVAFCARAYQAFTDRQLTPTARHGSRGGNYVVRPSILSYDAIARKECRGHLASSAGLDRAISAQSRSCDLLIVFSS